MIALQQSHLPESAEILDILNKIEFEAGVNILLENEDEK